MGPTTATMISMLAATLVAVLATTSAAAPSLHALGSICCDTTTTNCSKAVHNQQQQGWLFDSSDDTIKFGSAGCLSETPNWSTLSELEIAPCEPGSPKQNFTFDQSHPFTGQVKHGPYCLALNMADEPGQLRLELSGCSSQPNQMFANENNGTNGNTMRTGGQCISAVPTRPASWAPRLFDLWTGHDSFIPRGIYRIPSMITTNNGTLIVFAQARVHSTDATPSSIVMRRSFDDGISWEPSRIVLPDYFNATEQVGETLHDPVTDTIFFFENHVDFRIRHPGCSTCVLWQMSSTDLGLTWTNQTVIKLADPTANQTEPWGGGNRTFGGGLASGIALRGGPNKGRLLAALRHDCGCDDSPASFVVFSDDHGSSWTGGALLPEPGELFPGMPSGPPNQTNGALGGWTECQVAELRNGSVLLTSRNLYALSSGLGGRMFARSDDGGANWAQIWSVVNDPQLGLTSTYCEASIVGVPDQGMLYYGGPDDNGRRANYAIHSSQDGGLVWKSEVDVFGGGAAYSDLSMTRDGDVAFVFERGPSDRYPYAYLSFGKIPTGSQRMRQLTEDSEKAPL